MTDSPETLQLDNVPMTGYSAGIVQDGGNTYLEIYGELIIDWGMEGFGGPNYSVSTDSFSYTVSGRYGDIPETSSAGTPLYYTKDGIYFSKTLYFSGWKGNVFFTSGGSYSAGEKVLLSSSPSTYQGPTQGDPICYLAGSKVATPTGHKNIEDIHVGDCVKTYTQQHEVTEDQEVIWIGCSNVCVNKNLPDHRAGYPVRVLKDAFSENVPFKDLLVTPEHGIYLEGKFIPARMLVNNATIFFDKSIESYKYYHIETNKHSIIKVDGVFSETYLDTGNRRSFVSKENIIPFSSKNQSWEQDAAAPIGNERDFVEPIFHKLLERAKKLNVPVEQKHVNLTFDPSLHIVLRNGEKIFPSYEINGKFSFVLPENVSEISIVSKSSRPCDTVGPFLNQRNYLGVAIGDIFYFEDKSARKITQHLTTPNLPGWYNLEWEDTRWTRGNATLSLGERTPDSQGLLIIQVKAAGPYIEQNYKKFA